MLHSLGRKNDLCMRLSSASFSWAYFLLETVHMTLKNRKKVSISQESSLPTACGKIMEFFNEKRD